MRQAVVFIAVAVMLVGAGAGYLIVDANGRTKPSITEGTPIPIASVLDGNISIGSGPYSIATNPNASRIYIADGSNDLTVVDAVSHRVVARVKLPAPSSSITIDQKTGTVYALVGGGIAIVSGATNAVVNELPADFGFRLIAFDSSTDILYGAPAADYLVGVDALTGTVTQNVSIGHWAGDILVNPRLNLIYLTGCTRPFVCSPVLTVVNGTTAELQNVVGGATFTIDEQTGFVYASGMSQLAALKSDGTMIYESYSDTCAAFVSMTDDPMLNQVIVAPAGYDYLLVYDGSNGTLSDMYSLPHAPHDVAFNPVTNETYVIVSGSLLTFKEPAGTGYANGTLIGSGQRCLFP